jgi:hypothetical protein
VTGTQTLYAAGTRGARRETLKAQKEYDEREYEKYLLSCAEQAPDISREIDGISLSNTL